MNEPPSEADSATLEGIILRPSDLAFPSTAEMLFGRGGGFALEIGFGNGDFLCRLAADHPERNVIGADTSPSSVIRAYRRISRRGLTNAKVFAGTGEFVVRNVIPDGALERVYVNFPDPWPRRRHHGRRLLSAEFLELLACRLGDQGTVLLTTDHEDYYRFACAAAKKSGFFDRDEHPAPAGTLRTRWAQRWLDAGCTIYHAQFRKTRRPDTPAPRLTLTGMQHSLLRGSLDAITDFEKFVLKRDGVNIVVSEAHRQIGEKAVIFPTIVEENDLRQFVLIEAHPRGDEVLVGVKRFGQPLSTPGVNMAVTAVADYLAGVGLEILERTY
ncbi:MAG: tRNA (guanosine(46)-N7)-methyltransferase TrmB [Rhodothermales bacterium]|nr:tRNA (guanosine(46)-N7)-methyltransferase TrmB [Rhodothermales bacterium]